MLDHLLLRIEGPTLLSSLFVLCLGPILYTWHMYCCTCCVVGLSSDVQADAMVE